MTTVIGLGGFGKEALTVINEHLENISFIYIDKENVQELNSALEQKSDVFVISGLGGTAGAELAPAVCHLLRHNGIRVTLIVTQPFSFESQARKNLSEESINNLKNMADHIKIISNEDLLTEVQGEDDFLNIIRLPFKIITNYIRDMIKINGLFYREDYFDYLVFCGIEQGTAFELSEYIRKGKFSSLLWGKKQEYIKFLYQHDIPQEFIEKINNTQYAPTRGQ